MSNSKKDAKKSKKDVTKSKAEPQSTNPANAAQPKVPQGVHFSFNVAGRFRLSRRGVKRLIAKVIIAATLLGLGGGIVVVEQPQLPPKLGPAACSLMPHKPGPMYCLDG